MTQNDILSTRPLAPGDFEAWFPLWSQYLAHNKAKMRWPDRTALFRKLSHQQDNTAAMVVECNGQMVGIAHYQIHNARFAFENAYHVQDIFITPEYQSMRAGAELVAAVYRTAHQNGAPTVYWMNAENIYRRGKTATTTSSFIQFRKAA